MKTNVKLLTALLAMALVSVSAFAQQTARRDSDVNRRKEVKVERQQNKVDKGQKSTNISNQNVTDKKVRESQGNNRPSGGSGSLNGGNHGSVNANSGNHGHGNVSNGNHGGVNNGSHSSGSNHGNVNNGNHGSGGNNHGNVNNGSHSSGGNNHGNVGNGNHGSGGNNHGNVSGGNHGSGNHHVEHHDGRHEEHARRPSMAPVIEYNRIQVYERTNASSIVVSTNFRSKREAYDYIEWLLAEKTYAVFSYGNNYNWLQTEVAFIPTPFDWTNPMTHNQFRIKFNISQSLFGVIRVTITAEWRESYLSDSYSRLRFQPSNSYSTYYAWNVLEDFASSIPHNVIAYR
jgi:hypothetical protein